MSFKVLNSFNFSFIKGMLLLNAFANDKLHVKFQAASVSVKSHMVFFIVPIQRILLQKLH